MIVKLCHKILWKLSDDATFRLETLGEQYLDVPEHLKHVNYYSNEYQEFPSHIREEVITWLNQD